MHRAGRASIYIGIALVAIGLIVGFTAMFMDYDDQAKILIGLVPIGFVLLLAGTVATQLSTPRDKQ
jgi:uncharacterized membrane protein